MHVDSAEYSGPPPGQGQPLPEPWLRPIDSWEKWTNPTEQAAFLDGFSAGLCSDDFDARIDPVTA